MYLFFFGLEKGGGPGGGAEVGGSGGGSGGGEGGGEIMSTLSSCCLCFLRNLTMFTCDIAAFLINLPMTSLSTNCKDLIRAAAAIECVLNEDILASSYVRESKALFVMRI